MRSISVRVLPLAYLMILGTASYISAADFTRGVEAYLTGDYSTAYNEWRYLADKGESAAQFNIGLLYDYGQGVSQDYKQAIMWYTKSAEHGGIKAKTNLGRMFAGGKGIDQDYKKAVYWYTQAAEQGDVYAQFNLGLAYSNGLAGQKDYARAYAWYYHAASQGIERAIEKIDLLLTSMTPDEVDSGQELYRQLHYKIYNDPEALSKLMRDIQPAAGGNK